MEVKERILNKISKIEDESFLQELDSIIANLQSSEGLYALNSDMIKSLEISDADIKHGRTQSHDQVMNEMRGGINGK